MAERIAHFPGRAPIDAYGNGGFRFADMSHRGSLLCLPSGVYAWEPVEATALAPEHFAAVLAEAGAATVLLLGTGSRQQFPSEAVRRALAAAGVGLEVMDTGAACRTYNVLLAERRPLAAALIAVYIVLGVLYESYIHPLTILSTLPSAGVGALIAIGAVGMDVSIIAIIGIILLIGIVKKNGIMMVDFALHAQRSRGLPPEQAIFEACLLRFRPIMMTTMCALLAGVPLMLGTGTGSEIRQPLGYAIVGGLILSQALTLFTTPVIYLYLDRLGARLSGKTA